MLFRVNFALTLNTLEQVISHMKASPLKISLQLDKTTNVSNCSQHIAPFQEPPFL